MGTHDKRPVRLVLVIRAPDLKKAAFFLTVVENEIDKASRRRRMATDRYTETFANPADGDGYKLRVEMLEG